MSTPEQLAIDLTVTDGSTRSLQTPAARPTPAEALAQFQTYKASTREYDPAAAPIPY